ncbi:hypothetical protein [Paenibacillus algicola]|nr:hypothetical protein [Paenibacillus algicola]
MSISFLIVSILLVIIAGTSIGVGIKFRMYNVHSDYYLLLPILAVCLVSVMPAIIFKRGYVVMGDITEDAINSLIRKHSQSEKVPYKKVSRYFRFQLAASITIGFYKNIPMVLNSMAEKFPKNEEARITKNEEAGIKRLVYIYRMLFEMINKILMIMSEKERINTLEKFI